MVTFEEWFKNQSKIKRKSNGPSLRLMDVERYADFHAWLSESVSHSKGHKQNPDETNLIVDEYDFSVYWEYTYWESDEDFRERCELEWLVEFPRLKRLEEARAKHESEMDAKIRRSEEETLRALAKKLGWKVTPNV